MFLTKSKINFSNEKRNLFKEIVWPNIVFYITLHIATFYGIFLVFTRGVLFKTAIYNAIIQSLLMLGITIGAHRYYSHRTFKTNSYIRILFIVLQTYAGQNSMFTWARDHRLHHKYTDTDADPHNSKNGFFFAHMGWLMCKKHPLVMEKGRDLNLADLQADSIVMFQHRNFKKLYFVTITSFILIPVIFWNESLTISFFLNFIITFVFGLHRVWIVNSVAHRYGMKPFNKDIRPCENKFVSYISFGEGFHNYHHVFPYDYRASEYGMNASLSTKVIDLWAKMGWVWDLKKPQDEYVLKMKKTKGDQSSIIYSSTIF